MQIDLQPMAETTLARKLGIAPRISMLHKKAGNIGIPQPEHWIALAVQRGCYHYRNDQTVSAISTALLSNEELSALLLSGANPYRPLLIRVAAQLLSSPAIDTTKLARLRNFMTISSDIYPDLARHYGRLIDRWVDAYALSKIGYEEAED